MAAEANNNGRRSFISVAGWSQHHGPDSNPQRFGHIRSLSSITQSSTFRVARSDAASSSTSQLSNMAANDVAPARASTPQPRRLTASISASSSFDDEHDMSTIPDPRSRAMSPAIGSGEGSPASLEHHPDLNDEVATLSTKLINAINHQTTLDDTLSQTRMELEQSREKIRQLESQNAQQREMLAGDVWVRRKTVEAEKVELLARLAGERRAREEVEQQKRKIELELENLTTALFEEANKMVITAKEDARKEQDILHRKNDSLRAQLADAEGLLKSQQEQLAELKHVMEQMTVEHDDQTTALTAPSSPGFSRFDAKDEDRPTSAGGVGSPAGPPPEPVSPSNPTSFTHLLQPVLRTDLAAYEDFVSLIRTSRRLSMTAATAGGASRSRPPSGTQSSLLGLGGYAASSATPAADYSPTSLSAVGTPASVAAAGSSSPQTPNTPASTVSMGSPAAAGAAFHLPPLKETKFYKRVVAEDIEPTLRLDTAPGLSWLARRSVLNAMTEGSLVVEPAPSTMTTSNPLRRRTNPQLQPCSLCGDNRQDDEFLRAHRFRTSESDSAQRYPLCRYCLGRVRSTCDFLGFLRMVRDGHWRADDEDAEKTSWEESVRLREQMFWSRIGGGVIPAGGVSGGGGGGSGHAAPHSVGDDRSPRPSHEEPKVVVAAPGAALDGEGEDHPVSEEAHTPREIIEEGVVEESAETVTTAITTEEPSTPEEDLPASTNNRDSTQSLDPGAAAAADSDEGSRKNHLSIHIPGVP